MRRVVYAAICVLLAMALPSCMQPPTSGAMAAPIGSTGAANPSEMIYTPHPAPPPLKNATVDQTQSQALTDYLKNHRLPLVGAQVLAAPDGERQVILFGYVASGYGKQDAENKAHAYMKNAAVTVDNRITIQPELASANAPPGTASAPSGNSNSSAQSAYDPSLGNAQQYQQQSAQDPYSNYQAYQSQSSGPSMLSTIVPLLGVFGGSFGSAGMGGGSFGGFGTGYGSYGGMGYPSYPPSPAPGFGPAPPYPPYP
ncbi:MAG: hypothetical protein WBE78_05670 [Candidatus Binataceae bacterium]